MITTHARPRRTDRQTNIMAIARRFVLTNASRAKNWGQNVVVWPDVCRSFIVATWSSSLSWLSSVSSRSVHQTISLPVCLRVTVVPLFLSLSLSPSICCVISSLAILSSHVSSLWIWRRQCVKLTALSDQLLIMWPHFIVSPRRLYPSHSLPPALPVRQSTVPSLLVDRPMHVAVLFKLTVTVTGHISVICNIETWKKSLSWLKRSNAERKIITRLTPSTPVFQVAAVRRVQRHTGLTHHF